jgi:hypothetical protein
MSGVEAGRSAFVAVGVLALVGGGCAGTQQLDRRMDQLTRTLQTVEARGALRCAPRELAIARSHLEFARLEREQGSPSRFRQHLDIAEDNVQAAGVLASPGQCASASETTRAAPASAAHSATPSP